MRVVVLVLLVVLAGCDDDGAAMQSLGRPLDRLAAPVEVLTDTWGNHHIYAADKWDAAWMQCYLLGSAANAWPMIRPAVLWGLRASPGRVGRCCKPSSRMSRPD